MINESWSLIRAINHKLLKMPPHISEYIAVEAVLRLSAQGVSNETIAKVLDFDVLYIENVIREFLVFSGWKTDLDINVYNIYKRTGTYLKYSKEIRLLTPLMTNKEILTSYLACRIFNLVEKEIDNYYVSRY
jgi:hypothetical protein